MTEQDARKKWCPAARKVVSLDNVERQPLRISSANRTQYDKPICACIASDCMAWRMTRAELGISNGFCGLAGRPE